MRKDNFDRLFSISFLSPFLNIGTILNLFKEEGKLPDFINIFISLVQWTISKFKRALSTPKFLLFTSWLGLFFKESIKKKTQFKELLSLVSN